jgi:regulatory protein YycI of two-component signal transduction system YycFG
MKGLKKRESKKSFMKLLLVIVAAMCLGACSSGGGKKVIVMASGKVQVSGNTITLQPGTTHNEATVEPDGETVSVSSPSGNQNFEVKEAGVYVLNLKKDTLVGSYQRTGTDNSQQVISQDDLFNRVDSLTALMKGTNVSEAAKNYNIPPMSIARISQNSNAQIIGPFRKIPGSFDPSKEHEIYKFYTNKEVAEIIANVRKMLSD